MQEHKIIFHIDKLDQWDLLLKNVDVLVNALNNKKYDIEVLATSEAFKFYDVNENSNANISLMRELNKKGVKFVFGKNHLITNNISKNNLVKFVDTVPVESLELINKQNDGYIYLQAWNPYAAANNYLA